MKIMINEEATRWFEEEVGLPEGMGIRFKPRIYGSSPVTKGYALSFEPNEPQGRLAAKAETANGLLFFVDEEDAWFFNDHDLIIEFDPALEEPKYLYQPSGDTDAPVKG